MLFLNFPMHFLCIQCLHVEHDNVFTPVTSFSQTLQSVKVSKVPLVNFIILVFGDDVLLHFLHDHCSSELLSVSPYLEYLESVRRRVHLPAHRISRPAVRVRHVPVQQRVTIHTTVTLHGRGIRNRERKCCN